MMTKNNLQIAVDKAIETGAKYFAIIVNIFGDEEIIINNIEAVKNHKVKHWLNVYDNNLVKVDCKDVKMTGFTFGDDFASIEEDLLG